MMPAASTAAPATTPASIRFHRTCSLRRLASSEPAAGMLLAAGVMGGDACGMAVPIGTCGCAPAAPAKPTMRLAGAAADEPDMPGIDTGAIGSIAAGGGEP